MLIFGIWTESDGGFCEGPFDSRKEAEDFRAEQIAEAGQVSKEDADDLEADTSVKGMCPDHEGQPRIDCEDCEAEDEDDEED